MLEEFFDGNVTVEYCNSDLYIAFGLLLLAQIIKHGKELKEEQELTI